MEFCVFALTVLAIFTVLRSSHCQLVKARRKAARPPLNHMNMVERKLKIIFNMLDTDNNGQIGHLEVAQLLGLENKNDTLSREQLKSKLNLRQERVELLFERFDDNKDNLLDSGEVVHFLESLDTDDDSAITFTEFKESAIQKFSHHTDTAESYALHDEF